MLPQGDTRSLDYSHIMMLSLRRFLTGGRHLGVWIQLTPPEKMRAYGFLVRNICTVFPFPYQDRIRDIGA